MAALTNARWIVLIVADKYEGLDKTYRMPVNTSLDVVMRTWVDECHLSIDWRFLSADAQTVYEDWMTLEMVGETVANSGVVSLKAELQDGPIRKPVSEIFVHHNNQCHLMHVEPSQKLYEVLSSPPGRSSACQCNDEQLNLSKTVEQAGLENNVLLHEPRRQINVNVKLSYGNIVIIRVPEDSLVHHLVMAIRRYETEEFSLQLDGRHLKPDELVKELKQVIEVTSARFVVNIHGQQITWTSKSEPIVFPQFIRQLSSKGNFNEEELETMEYRCIGCQRCIYNSENDVQILPVPCCREQSLTLIAIHSIDKQFKVEAEALNERMQGFYEQLLLRKSVNARKGIFREFYSKVEEEVSTSQFKYNKIIQSIEKLRCLMNKASDRLKTARKDQSMLKIESGAFSEITKTDEETKTEPGEGLIDESGTRNIGPNEDADESRFAATAEPSRTDRTSIASQSVALFVVYDPDEFCVAVTRPEVQSLGRFSNSSEFHYLKCAVTGFYPGWVTFDEVRNALQPMFVAGKIRAIGQVRGNADGMTVVVIAPADDDGGVFGESSIHGYQHLREQAEGKQFYAITAPGDDVMGKHLKKISVVDVIDTESGCLIVVGRHRTVLHLLDLPSAD